MKHLQTLTEREFNTNETLQLLKASGPVFWSWGVSEIINYNNEGLLLRVKGHHHSGWVFIILQWNDTYRVHYLNQRYNVKDSASEIYFDMLVNEIDTRVEKIEDYK
ncbi:hypothetical protein GCM10007103_25850 [Salinimicrobium marinum]|uniref:Uncharacterized protein n=1 Tax=Salinimicrobium marinum TaxID=680283 RepID=A0A918SHT5_9FLAO|nr:hypothetical protein [Salinimicrobium marinum]GHA43530.1 hypothetical protein GCM10007103_25850 [Salinimicrobium marinum]